MKLDKFFKVLTSLSVISGILFNAGVTINAEEDHYTPSYLQVLLVDDGKSGAYHEDYDGKWKTGIIRADHGDSIMRSSMSFYNPGNYVNEKAKQDIASGEVYISGTNLAVQPNKESGELDDFFQLSDDLFENNKNPFDDGKYMDTNAFIIKNSIKVIEKSTDKSTGIKEEKDVTANYVINYINDHHFTYKDVRLANENNFNKERTTYIYWDVDMTDVPDGDLAAEMSFYSISNPVGGYDGNGWTNDAKMCLPMVFISQVNVNTSIDDGGTITPSTSGIDKGNNFEINITPTENKVIDKVTLNGEDVTDKVDDGKLTIDDIDKDYDVVVTTKDQPKTYDITTSIGKGGTITPSTSVNENGSVTVDFDVKEGFEIDKVIVDGKDVTDKIKNNSYSFENVNENHSIDVSTKEIVNTVPENDNIDTNVGVNTPTNEADVNSNAIKTGDDTQTFLLCSICVLSSLGIVGMLLLKKKKYANK